MIHQVRPSLPHQNVTSETGSFPSVSFPHQAIYKQYCHVMDWGPQKKSDRSSLTTELCYLLKKKMFLCERAEPHSDIRSTQEDKNSVVRLVTNIFS